MSQQYNSTQKKRTPPLPFFETPLPKKLTYLVEMEREKRHQLSNLQAKISITNQQLNYLANAICQEKDRQAGIRGRSNMDLVEINKALESRVNELQVELERALSLNSKIRFIVSELVERVQHLSAQYIDSWELIQGCIQSRRQQFQEVSTSLLKRHRQLSLWINDQMSGIKEQSRMNQRKSSQVAISRLLVKEVL